MQQKMNNLSVLVIEDDHELGAIFLEILASVGLGGELIRDGRTARERLGAIEPDLVVMDLHLPAISGLELLEQIRGDTRLAHTRVVVMTADVPMAEVAGELAHAVLVKPVSLDSFVETIQLVACAPGDS